ncbi:MAG: J domain-containing protein [Pirellulales bacterium]
MLPAKNLYALLGADPADDTEAIKAHYRRRSRECHPDRPRGDAEAAAEFKAITQAFEVLSDPERRRTYDATGRSGQPNDRRGRALAIIGHWVHQLLAHDLQKGAPTAQRELLIELRRAVGAGTKDLRQKLDQMEKHARLIEDVAARITHQAGGENVLAAIVRAPLEEIHAGIASAQTEIANHEEAAKVLSEYKFRRASGGEWTIDLNGADGAVCISGARPTDKRGNTNARNRTTSDPPESR